MLRVAEKLGLRDTAHAMTASATDRCATRLTP
jgi:hypothetical protein